MHHDRAGRDSDRAMVDCGLWNLTAVCTTLDLTNVMTMNKVLNFLKSVSALALSTVYNICKNKQAKPIIKQTGNFVIWS